MTKLLHDEMASRSDDSLEPHSFPKDRMELTCPVCLEEFEDPKILPNCKHNVCRHCLQNMVKRKSSKALCPVCRSEFALGPYGIQNLATNTELVEIVRNSREEREKQGVATMFETCVQKMSDANKLLEDHKLFSQQRQEYGDQLQDQIHSLADNIISCVRKKEKELCEQVQKEIARHEKESDKQRTKTEKLVEEASAVVSKLEDVLNNQDEITTEQRQDIIIGSKRIIDVKMCENLNPFDVVMANFSPNMSILSKIEKEGFGKVYSTNGNYFTNSQSNSGSEVHSPSHYKPLQPYITVRADDLGLEYFAPLSLATDGKKHIAVADPANSNVLLLDNTGQLLKRFKPPGKNIEPHTFSGVAFTGKEGELLAVCGSTEVFYLNIKDGDFKMTYRTNEKYGVRYCFVTVGCDGRVLLTCEPSMRHSRSCIFMYKDIPFGKPDLMFGLNGYDHRLEFPFKAIYHDDQYYVSDMEKGCILVYSSQGVYCRQFGGKDEDSPLEGQQSSSHIVLPTGMALCPDKKCFYICDWGSSSVQVYKPDGTFVAMFTIEGRPTDIVLLDNGTVVVSSKDDQWIKFYNFPSFNLD